MKIGVIGGGVAGLYCAQLLKDRGHSVVVLEQSGRVGGRVYPRPSAGASPMADLGGEFIHGERTLLAAFARARGLSLVQTFCSFPSTDLADDGTNGGDSEFLWLATEEKLVSWRDALRDDPEFREAVTVLNSLWDDDHADVARELARRPEQSVLQFLLARGVKQRMIGLMDAVLAKTWATDLERLPALAVHREETLESDCGGNNFVFADSTAVLLRELTRDLTIYRHCRVTEVTVKGGGGGGGVHVVWEDSSGRRHQELGGGGGGSTRPPPLLVFDRVVMSAPPTALRAITFSPALPVTVRQFVDQADLGHAVKIVAQFRRRFWPPAVQLVFCADSVVPQIWMAPPAVREREEAAQCVLVTGFITGRQAQVSAGWPVRRLVRAFLNQLDRMFASPNTGSSADHPVPSSLFIDHAICNWRNEAYSHPSAVERPREHLALCQGRLVLAGEHVGQQEIGTINAAMESGEWAANHISLLNSCL